MGSEVFHQETEEERRRLAWTGCSADVDTYLAGIQTQQTASDCSGLILSYQASANFEEYKAFSYDQALAAIGLMLNSDSTTNAQRMTDAESILTGMSTNLVSEGTGMKAAPRYWYLKTATSGCTVRLG